jgi:hypothetical protein
LQALACDSAHVPTQSVASLVNALKGSSMDKDVIAATVLVGFFAFFAWGIQASHDARMKFRARLASITDVALFLCPFAPFDESHRAKRDRLIRLAAERGWNVVGQYYADRTPSGTVNETSFKSLLGNCDLFNLVFAFAVAGFGKSRFDPDAAYLAMNKLMERGVGVLTLDGSVDCSTETGRKAFSGHANNGTVLGVTAADDYCGCGHQTTIDVSDLPGNLRAGDHRLRCSKCGKRPNETRPDWSTYRLRGRL